MQPSEYEIKFYLERMTYRTPILTNCRVCGAPLGNVGNGYFCATIICPLRGETQ